ncbi:hypothetical protein [Polyangium fumosum]|uniref:Uncharacterized protein n=1 Tax=Polyangium fumosum TaxID=889272 RepID=A0A4U1IEN9_9BACT|nr:hypothetical protein [Polyangium fumosum]TKC92132.1 hypothetical protein E8A74_50325 [Polyangium fumosum]
MPFARSILAKASALRSIDLLPNQRARILESISDDIKKCTNFIAPQVSTAAWKEAERLGVDLYSKNWHDQPAFDAGRQTFHFEHVLPVSAIRDACLELNSEAAIFDVLKKLRVAWILKTEDAELTVLRTIVTPRRAVGGKAFVGGGREQPASNATTPSSPSPSSRMSPSATSTTGPDGRPFQLQASSSPRPQHVAARQGTDKD